MPARKKPGTRKKCATGRRMETAAAPQQIPSHFNARNHLSLGTKCRTSTTPDALRRSASITETAIVSRDIRAPLHFFSEKYKRREILFILDLAILQLHISGPMGTHINPAQKIADILEDGIVVSQEAPDLFNAIKAASKKFPKTAEGGGDKYHRYVEENDNWIRAINRILDGRFEKAQKEDRSAQKMHLYVAAFFIEEKDGKATREKIPDGGAGAFIQFQSGDKKDPFYNIVEIYFYAGAKMAYSAHDTVQTCVEALPNVCPF